MSSLVLFDIDGTLLRGAGNHHKLALLEGVRRVTGLAASFDGIDTAGQLDRDLIAALLGPSNLDEETRHAIALECCHCYSTNCAINLSPFVCKGAREALDELHTKGSVLGLVTGNLGEIGWRKMELAGLRHFFSLGSFSEHGETRAQLAQIAAARAKELGLVSEDCRVSLIGDHANDIRAAQANGFQAVAVASGVMSRADLASFAPDILLNDLAELDAAKLL